MVGDALIYHPSVSHYLKFVATTTGRDKLLRTIQYFARFYAWYLYRLNGSPAEIAPWEAVKKNFGTVRRPTKVQRALLLNVVIGERPPVFKLLPGEDQTLLVRRYTLLVLNLRLNVVDRV